MKTKTITIMEEKEQYSDFTNLYQLSKTLRFELKPVGKTAETFKQWLSEMNNSDKEENLFAKDKKIKNAYMVIKPIIDKLHERFIEKSLTSNKAKKIDFSPYIEAYKQKNVLDTLEEGLRKKIGETYIVAGGFQYLTDKRILNYLSDNVQELAKQNGIDERTLANHIEQFKGFGSYLSGYNQNRMNYYTTKEEQSTAVATRIVHENLPTFCDNILRFEKSREGYLSICQYLKDNNREIKIKNAQGEETEAETITEAIFQIKHFNSCLAQSQIEEYNRIIGNYNFLINLYNQARREEKEFKKLDEFESLYKQIGCGEKKSLFESLHDDSDLKALLQKIKEAGDTFFKECCDETEISTVSAFIKLLKECDNWEGIYMSSAAVNKISNLYFTNWHSIKDKLKESNANACITYDKDREEPVKLRDAVELSELFAVLNKESLEHLFKESLFKDNKLDTELTPSQNLINLLCSDVKQNIDNFWEHSEGITDLINDKNQSNEETQKIKQIKEWLDAAMNAMRIVRYFAVRKSKMKGNMPNVTIEQALSNLLYNDDAQWFKWYDLIRNYLTKKPQDDVKENKLKLNFGNSTLMNGWDMNKERDNTAVIIRRNNLYYLGIMDKNYNKILDADKIKSDDKSSYYEKMDYKQIALPTGVGGFVRKCFDTAQQYDWSCPKDCLNEDGKIIIKDDEARKNLTKIIDCYKDFFDKYEKDGFKYRNFNFRFLKSTEYEKLSDFFKDVERQRYMIKFRNISADYIDDLVNEGKLYLFQIYNKDFSTGRNERNGSKGKPNMHTLYWKTLFDETNLNDVVYKLNGQAEIFMREPVAKESPVKHGVGSKLVNKRDKDGNTIPEQIYKEIYLFANDKVKKENLSAEAKNYIESEKVKIKEAKYEIVKDNRFYGETKYMFHCPITINFKAGSNSGVNEKITDALQQSDNLQFIGIDRGEKHLVYSCTIDKYGKIIKCNHHDNINGTDYVQKLEAVANERLIAKKNWQQQNRIKDLKSGYISHVVHRLVEETIKDDKTIAPHAYIVLEDLNSEMKRGRQKIEKQVYQNLELALAKKFNFVVDKTAKQGELGSVSMALQLTPPVTNYKDIEGKKRFGIMLYTRANYTSITDPATGWRKTIYIKNGKDEEIKVQIIDKFSNFGFDEKDYYFEYTEENAGHTWRMYSGKDGKPLPRFQNKKQMLQDKNIWVPEQINVKEILDKLFANFDKGRSFKEQVNEEVKLEKIEGRSETAWQSLRYALNMIQQIRNSGVEKTDDNFLYSPVRNENGEHFDTRNPQNNGGLELIVDADANGAFNIARKGLIMDAHIKKWIKEGKPTTKEGDSKTPDLDLFISDREWDLWLLDREEWKKYLPVFASKSKKDADKTTSTKSPKRKKK